jgi:hypothetical protein
LQLIINPVRWTNEAATQVTNWVAVEMESQAHMDENKRRMAGYPASMLSDMRGGNSLYQPYIPHQNTEAEAILCCVNGGSV